jgi:hypothetical protein
VGENFPIGKYKNLGVLRAEKKRSCVSVRACGCGYVKSCIRTEEDSFLSVAEKRIHHAAQERKAVT